MLIRRILVQIMPVQPGLRPSDNRRSRIVDRKNRFAAVSALQNQSIRCSFHFSSVIFIIKTINSKSLPRQLRPMSPAGSVSPPVGSIPCLPRLRFASRQLRPMSPVSSVPCIPPPCPMFPAGSVPPRCRLRPPRCRGVRPLSSVAPPAVSNSPSSRPCRRKFSSAKPPAPNPCRR